MITTECIDNMNVQSCAVQLLRFDEIQKSNNELFSKNTDTNNQSTAEVKRSTRISRKRSTPSIEDSNQSDTAKKKKCIIKKSQSSKAKSNKTVITQKEPKIIKNQNVTSIMSTESYPIIGDLSVITDVKLCPNNVVDNDGIISMPSLLKPSKIKISKSMTSVKNKSIIHDVNNDDPSNEHLKPYNLVVALKSPKTKTPKSITSKKKNPMLNNVNNINTSYELEENNAIISTKTPKNKTPKAITSNKKKPIVNNLNNDDTLKINDSFAVPKSVPKSKTTKSIASNRKKPVVNNINQSITTNEHETSDKIKIPRKRGRNSLKKEQCQKLEFDIMYNDNLQQIQSSSIDIIKTPSSNEELKLSQNLDDDTIILKSNDKPPKIWSYGNDAISESVNVCNMPCSTSSINISILPTTGTESTFSNENIQQSHLSTVEPIFNSNDLSVSMISTENTEMSYGMAILSEAISRQCRESANQNAKKKSPEPEIIEKPPSPEKVESTSQQSQQPPRRNIKNTSSKVPLYSSESCLESVENELESRVKREIHLLSKRFNIPSDCLWKTVVDEPLSVFQKKYCESVTPSMVTISPIVQDDAKSRLNINYQSGNIDVEYKVEPIRESGAYEKNKLKDLMEELSKTMPSWSLSIVTNPPRYVISHISISTCGIPTANKCIVLDKLFRASIYINQCLEHKFSKRYTTATEIVNLIKELDSI